MDLALQTDQHVYICTSYSVCLCRTFTLATNCLIPKANDSIAIIIIITIIIVVIIIILIIIIIIIIILIIIITIVICHYYKCIQSDILQHANRPNYYVYLHENKTQN